MKIKVKRPKYYLLIYVHFYTKPMFYLIPEKRVSPRFKKVLKNAHNDYINTNIGYIPDDTHQIRMALSRWLDRYQITFKPMGRAPNIINITVTGQIS